eukprot:gb/GEZN01002125.1/.p1 GENE.gb/GEZN01002125.1/~~gb/GEZN01002125.1/.p1  ORF type:complete len:791 (+),score=207.21 gb/GEZN01002125.1/:109-2481(+)
MARLIRHLLLLALLALLSVTCRSEEAAAETEAATPSADPGPSDTFTEEQLESLKSTEEVSEFQAEVTRLMDIIINSLYSNREVFLREIISNAADALDKTRYLKLHDGQPVGDDELQIKIRFDKDAKTLTIMDTGVGMTKEDLKNNLGIVARSGTTEFVKAASAGEDALSLIGQFGVGFYSVYLVSDRVTVVSKHDKDDQYIWESRADKTFTVAKDPRGNTLGRGTQLTLHLKEDALEFASEQKLEELIGRYSQFINYPISLLVSKTVSKEVPVKEEKEVKPEGEEEDLEVSDEEDEDKDKPKTKTVTEKVNEWKRINTNQAIWTRKPEDISEKEYEAFYSSLTKDTGGYLTKIHFSAEGEISFRSILFIPKKADYGLYDKFYEKSTALKLYVRKVLISDEFEDFLPRYMNFVKGVVDSDDLPLNVSRETLAQSKVLKVMARKITRKVLEMLRKLADSEEEDDEDEDEGTEKEEDVAIEKVKSYSEFWKQYGKSIKLGVMDDKANKQKLTQLLRYQTSKSDGEFISLDAYVERMQEDQKAIYYITGESVEAVEASPFLERLKKKDLEVVYMTDALDEYVTQQLTDYDGNTLVSVTKEGLKLGDEDEEQLDALKEEFEPLTAFLTKLYGKKVEKVVVGTRITDSPAVLVTGQYGWTANMERIMKAQTFSDQSKMGYMAARKTMEINPFHPVIYALKEGLPEDEEEKPSPEIEAAATLLFDAAVVSSGFQLEEPAEFSTRLNKLIASSLHVPADAPMRTYTPKAKEAEKEPVVEAVDAESEGTKEDAPVKEEL